MTPGRSAILVDVRPEAEFSEMHVVGATTCPPRILPL